MFRSYRPDLSVDEACHFAQEDGAPAYLVGTAEHLEGTVTRRRLEAARAAGNGEARVAAVMDREIVHVHPNHSLDVVLDRLVTSGGVLAVVSRANASRMQGVVTADTLLPFGDYVSPRRGHVSDGGTPDRPPLPVTIERVGDGKENPTRVAHLGGGQLVERSLDG